MNKEVKKLGVLGGMGPMATSVFFERIIKNTKAATDQEHVEMVILNFTSLPDRTVSIETGVYGPFLKKAKQAFDIFEFSKVSHIAIPCNTSHFFYRQLQEMTTIPIIHMIDKTVEALSKTLPQHSKIGVLGTDGTINHHVYKESIEKNNFIYVIPETKIQKKVMNVIYSVKASAQPQLREIEEIIEYMVNTRGCDQVILACTELSLLTIREDLKKYCIDALDVLVRESIRLTDKELENHVN